MLMKHNEQEKYLAPEFEVLYIALEQGFAGSTGQLPEYKEDDDEIILG